ncbi:hypothetical protein IWX48DRAFT_658339 [Phyllosticta citricarpa]
MAGLERDRRRRDKVGLEVAAAAPPTAHRSPLTATQLAPHLILLNHVTLHVSPAAPPPSPPPPPPPSHHVTSRDMPSFLPPDLADDLAELSASPPSLTTPASSTISIAKAALEFRTSRVIAQPAYAKNGTWIKTSIAEQFPLQAISSKTFIDSLARLTPNKFEDVLEELERAKATRLNPRVKNTRGVSRDPWFIVNDISTVKQLPGMSIRPARSVEAQGLRLDTISETPELVTQPQDQNNADQQDLVQPNVTMRKRAKLTHSSSPSARRSPSPSHIIGKDRRNATISLLAKPAKTQTQTETQTCSMAIMVENSAEERDVEHARCETMFDGGLAGAEVDKSWRGLLQLPGSPQTYPSPISNGQAAFPASPKSRQPRLPSMEDSQSEDTSEPDEVKGEPGNNGTSGAGNEVKQELGRKSTSGTGEQAKEDEPAKECVGYR